MQRRNFVVAAGALAAASSGIRAADPIFKQPVRLIVPASPGGFTDISARLVAERLTVRIGQPVVVDNRPGASGIIGAEAVARSAPDGATLLMGSLQSQAANVSLFKKLPYDAMKDFAPITRVAMGYNVLVVPAASPARTLQELIAQAKQKPGSLTYGSGGIGASSHLCAEMLRQAAGVDILHVPYKGTAPAVQAVIGKEISMLFDTVPSSLPFVKAGSLRALGVSSTKSLDAMPDVPAIADVLPGFEMSVWAGIYAPAGTSDAIVQAFNREIMAVLVQPEVVQRFEQLGFLAQTAGPEEFAAFNRAEITKLGNVIKAGRITLE